MRNQLRRRVKIATVSLVILLSTVFALLAYVTWDLIATFDSEPNEPLPSTVDINSISSLAQYAEKRVQRWQDSLFLETYSANYIITEQEGVLDLTLTDTVYFRFAGWRDDWLKGAAEKLGFAHLLASIEIDVNSRKLTVFNHSQGTGFGFDAPLDVVNWLLKDKELILICDQHGAREFRQTHNENRAGVYATSTRVGRNWEVAYGSQPTLTFACVVNLDTGEVSVRENGSDWLEVDNIYDLQQ
ncbi:MAG: hypothetical protein Kow0080_30300 [Candidatus Promineifilaceae bacterium]